MNTLQGLSIRFGLPGRLRRLSSFEALFLLALALIPILLYLPFIGLPFERDEGVYATVAQGILDGKIPYRDLFDNKPPLVYGWYAISFTLFGETVFAPRILAALALSLTGVLLYQHARLALPKGAAYTAAILFAISTGLPWVALHANTEAYLLLPLVGSLLAFTRGMKDGKLGWFFAAGLLAGLAMMTKQVAMWNLLALAMVALVWQHKAYGLSWKAVAPVFWLFTGTLISLAAVALPFALTGSLDDFLYATLSYNWVYARLITWAERAQYMGAIIYFLAVAAPFVVGALAGAVVLLRRRAQAMDYVLILWAIASAIGVASGGRFFPHYFLQLMPSLAVLTGVVIYDRFANGGHHTLSRPAWIIATLLIVISVGTTTVVYIAPRQAEQRIVEQVYFQKEWEVSSRDLGAYLKARTAPDDLIFNYGRESQIYFYADRQPAIPYFYDWFMQYEEEGMDKVMIGLRENPPVYFVDSVQAPLFPDWDAAHPAELREFLNENYDYASHVYFADVYRLKGYTGPAVANAD